MVRERMVRGHCYDVEPSLKTGKPKMKSLPLEQCLTRSGRKRAHSKSRTVAEGGEKFLERWVKAANVTRGGTTYRRAGYWRRSKLSKR